MTVEKKVVTKPLGEVTESDIQAADIVAKALLQTSGPRREVKLLLPDGREIEGVSFETSDGRKIIVTPDFIATEEKGKIEQFLPRR